MRCIGCIYEGFPMRVSKRRAVMASVAAGAAIAVSTAGGSATASGSAGDPGYWAAVPAATKAIGISVPNVLSPVLAEHVVAQGSLALDGGTAALPYYGYNGNGPMVPAPGALPAAGTVIEASKTEPDKNTYLVLKGQSGPDAAGAYGSHFIFQGHETGTRGFLTRVNLDADAAHRVTLMADTYTDGSNLPLWDGSTWNPFAKRLLMTAEGGPLGGVSQATVTYPSKVESLVAAFGRGGYEGVQNDSAGNIWLVEDSGGTTVPTSTRVPNSYVFRFVPVDKADLTQGGKLQALQVISNATHTPITYGPVDAANPTGKAFSVDEKDLHTYGTSFNTTWVTVHDTATDTSGAAFDANLAARGAGATPFKRPENGVFRPGSHFGEFFFTETGDTNLTSTANAGFGGFGGVFRLRQQSPNAATGKLSIVFNGTTERTGLDNLTFLNDRDLAVVEDAGDTIHTQRAKFDSGYVIDVKADYSTAAAPTRFLAEGRDVPATLDSAFLGGPGFNNDGDNEITGIHASDGDASTKGILGAKEPELFGGSWRLFWTEQHGDNVTWEITPSRT
jgi:hypothetical protein